MSTFIVSIKSKTQQSERELKKDSFVIGRGADCDICLNDSHISRVHLKVSVQANKVCVEDLNSSNGTFVNGAKLSGGVGLLVTPSDKIKLGQSEYTLKFQLKGVSPDKVLPVIPAKQEPVIPVKQEPVEPVKSQYVVPVKAEPVAPVRSEPVVSVKSDPVIELNSIQAEQVLHEAKKRAAQIVLEGEKQAEKRAQVIYQQVREAKELAEQNYQNRMAEAQRKADETLLDFQKKGQELIKEARNMAQELRDEVDIYVQSVKEKTAREKEEILSKANSAAEKMRNEAIAQGREEIKDEVEEAEKKFAEKSVALGKLTSELSEVQKKLETATASLEKARIQEEELRQKIKSEEQDFKDLLKEKEISLKDLHDKEEARLKSVIEKEEDRIRDFQDARKIVSDEKERLDIAVRTLHEKQVQLAIALQDMEEKKAELAKDYDKQKSLLHEKLENEKLAIEKSEQQYHEEVRREMTKRLQTVEQDFLDNMVLKKTALVKRIFAVYEKDAVTVIDPAQWEKLSLGLERKLTHVLDEELVSLSHSSINYKKPVDLNKKRESQKTRWIAGGLIGGAALLFGAQKVIEKVAQNQTPFQTLVSMEAQQRQEDLEKRRFNPAQVAEIKETYTDAVIYTKNFVSLYTAPEFQKKLYKAVSQYLLKTWRINEDKSIQVLAVSSALVTSLEGKRQNIHPDFIKDGIQKMRNQEAEVIAQMKVILGSDVRVESYRKFERDFYKKNAQ